jgi:predicted MPP superfamily phosphohydrolase
MPLFLIVIPTLLFGTWFYIGYSLFWPISDHPIYRVFLIAFLSLSLGLQIWRIILLRNPKASPLIVKLTFFLLGFMSQLLALTVFKDFLFLVFDPPHEIHFVFILIGFILNAVSMKNAFAGPRTKTIELKHPHRESSSPSQRKPLRMVQISDLHVGPIIQDEYVSRVVEQIQALNPDILVATGDIGDGDPELLSSFLIHFKKISAPKYYVTGNHEYYWKAPGWIKALESVGFDHLLNSGRRISIDPDRSLWLGGVPDLQGARFFADHKVDVKRSLSGSEAHDFKILLAHQPKVCDLAHEAGYDLMLSGHTHGGQFFPFTMLVAFFNPYSRGLNQHRKMQVYVNLGTGFWGPPLRLGAQSEITLFELY